MLDPIRAPEKVWSQPSASDQRPGNGSLDVCAEDCVNWRRKDVACVRCVTVCPADAIHLSAGRPLLDRQRCVACGACEAACPTGAFTQAHPPETVLGRVVSQRPERSLALACAQHLEPGFTRLPVEIVIRHPRCLAGLDVAGWLALSKGGRRTVWLADDPCAACAIGAVHAAIGEVVDAANRLLQAFDHTPAIHLSSAGTSCRRANATRLPVIDGAHYRLSRRGLFGALRQLAAAADEEAAPAPARADKLTHRRLPRRVPAQRRRLLQALAQLPPPAETRTVTTDGLPFADVQVDASRCSACGLCALFCPTGALNFAAEGGRFSLRLRAAICVACGLCASVCPETALGYGAELPAAALVAAEARPLAQGELIACQECGVETARRPVEAGTPRCSVCRQSAGAVRPLHDGAGLVNSLLDRLDIGLPVRP